MLLTVILLLSGCVYPLQHTSPDSELIFHPDTDAAAAQPVSDAASSDSVTGGTSEFSVPSPEFTPVSAPIAEPRLAIFWYAMADARVEDLRNALKPSLESKEIPFREYDAENDRYLQLDQIKAAVADGWNILAVNMVANDSADAATDILTASGNCPVVFFDRIPAEDSAPVFSAFPQLSAVAVNSADAGRVQGRMVGSWLAEHFSNADLNADGQISCVVLSESNSVTGLCTACIAEADAVLSQAGYPPLGLFRSDLSDSEEAAVWYVPDGDLPSDGGNGLMQAVLTICNTGNGNMIECVIADTDEVALGALTALQGSWYNLGDGLSVTVPLFGIGATAGSRMAIELGQMTGTVDLNAAAVADALLSTVENYISGEAAPKLLSVKPVPFPG